PPTPSLSPYTTLFRSDARAVADLQRGVRRLVEPELGVRLVGRDQEVVLGGQRREALEELERGDRAGRIVRVVDPNDRRSLPRLGDRKSTRLNSSHRTI